MSNMTWHNFIFPETIADNSLSQLNGHLDLLVSLALHIISTFTSLTPISSVLPAKEINKRRFKKSHVKVFLFLTFFAFLKILKSRKKLAFFSRNRFLLTHSFPFTFLPSFSIPQKFGPMQACKVIIQLLFHFFRLRDFLIL